MATTLSDILGSNDGAGLTRSGVKAAVREHVDLEGHKVTKSQLSIQDMYHVLIVRGRVDKDDLLEHFRPYSNHVPDQGHYGDLAADQWWDEVGAPALAGLPGVSVDQTAARFEGVDASRFEDEHVRPLEEIRSDPSVRAGIALDRLGVSRGSDERDELMRLFTALLDAGSATSEELDTVSRTVSFTDHESTFRELPMVSRSVETPPELDEISIETYQDVLDAREAVEADPVVRWEIASDNV